MADSPNPPFLPPSRAPDSLFSVPVARTPEPYWLDLCALEDLQVGVGMQVRLPANSNYPGVNIAVFKLHDGTVSVIEDACPHAGASLAHGSLEGNCVICPRHAWYFDLKSGRMPDSNIEQVARFAVKLEAGRVLADISRPIPIEPQAPHET